MSEVRIALLIGVARAAEAVDRFEPLDEPVAADLAAMEAVLCESGYDVEVLTQASGSKIGIRILEKARSAPEGATLLIYFTGHGIRLDGVDYLVPADAHAPHDDIWVKPYLSTLLRADISGYLTECKADTVLWIMDACRTTLPATGTAFGTSIEQGLPTGHFAAIVGCDVAQTCGFSAEGSHFTHGLVKALSPLSAPRTVHEVYEATAAHAKRFGQHVKIRYGVDRQDQTKAVVVCRGRHLLEEWRKAVEDQLLWSSVADDSAVPRLREPLLGLVEHCARIVHAAQQRLTDPWSDDDFAPRVLRRLGELLSRTSGVSAAEVAIMAAAVFLREAAWARRLSQAAEASPLDGDRQVVADPNRRHLEQIHAQHAHIAKKLTRCVEQGRSEDAKNIALWLVHRWIRDLLETDDTSVPDDLTRTFARGLLDDPHVDPGRLNDVTRLLRRLTTAFGTDTPLSDMPQKIRLREGYQPVDLTAMSAVLGVAVALAIDVRLLPDVVAEHLAISDSVTPQEVVGVVQASLEWTSSQQELDMDVACPHQVLHAALLEVATLADNRVASARQLAGQMPVREASILTELPERITAHNLRPLDLDGQKAYEVPLLRFQLAQTEVRSLLMGRQLYGDPALAIRELYQNSMDGCRYRDMRWRYLESAGKCPVGWRGRITLVQGTDDRGRYIECRDNGVGMGAEQLAETFTKAGSRFERSRTFRQEQALWLRHDPSLRLYPNSRFGIGVFSYFMLADEMTIVTRQVSPDGIPAHEALRVDIASSGSLFRIRRTTEPGDSLAEGGTRVRLYLRDDADLDDLSCVEVMQKTVGVSDFHLEVTDHTGSVEWDAGTLYPNRGHDGTYVQMAVPNVLWWVAGEGAILCDGITSNKKVFGYVLNLAGAHNGELSVNRNELLDYDQEWAAQNIRAGMVSLTEWDHLSLEWLWKLERDSIPTAHVVWNELRGKGISLAISPGQSSRYNLDIVGLMATDMELMQPPSRYEYGLLHPWRSAAYGGRHIHSDEPRPRSLVGYPVPTPGYADTLAELRAKTVAVHLHELPATKRDFTLQVLRGLRPAHPKYGPTVPTRIDNEESPAGADAIITAYQETRASRSRWSDVPPEAILVKLSADLKLPLDTVIEVCATQGLVNSVAIEAIPEQFFGYVCNDTEVASLFTSSGGPGIVDKAVVVRRQVHFLRNLEPYKDPQRLIDMVSRFTWLAWESPSFDSAALLLTGDMQTFDDVEDYVDETMTLDWTATVLHAVYNDLSLADAEADLITLAEQIDLSYEKHAPHIQDFENISPSGDTFAAALMWLYKEGCSWKQVPSIESIARACFRTLSDDAELMDMIEEMRRLGKPLPHNASALLKWNTLSRRTKCILSGNYVDDFEEEEGSLSYPTPPRGSVLLAAARQLNETLAEVWNTAEQNAQLFGFDVPPLPETLRDLRPTEHLVNALTMSGTLRSEEFDERDLLAAPEWTPLTAESLATYARSNHVDPGVAYNQLLRLRPLGALVPELTPKMIRNLGQATPDARDVLALRSEYRVSDKGEPFVALDLVSIAARLGEEISTTWQRILPYLPLGFDAHVPAAPEVIPLWQDLAILSMNLDGLLPAVSGRVHPERVALVAEEIGEAESWVWSRFRLYAEMFDLDVSGAEGEIRG